MIENWPFRLNILLAGLRKYLDAPGLKLNGVHSLPRPVILPGTHGEKDGQYRLHLFAADIELGGRQRLLPLLLKQFTSPPGKAGEYYFYRYLAMHLPLILPIMIAGDDNEGWLVTVAPGDVRAPQNWTVDDYREAVDNLADLHDRYWGLFEDLDTFSNLRHPLGSGHEKLVREIQQAAGILINRCPFPELMAPHYSMLFDCLFNNLEAIVNILKQEPFTLLHGNYWPDNIARLIHGRPEVAHWHQAAIGPAVLDAVMFARQVSTYLQPLFPVNAALTRYRVQLDRRQGIAHNNQQWQLHQDCALLWLLLSDRLPWMITLAPQLYTEWHATLQRVWFEPAARILNTHFGITLQELMA